MDSEQVVQVVLRVPAESRWRINRAAEVLGVSAQRLVYVSVMHSVQRIEEKHAMSDTDRKNDDPSQYAIAQGLRKERQVGNQERRNEKWLNGNTTTAVSRRMYRLSTDRPAEATATDLQKAKAK